MTDLFSDLASKAGISADQAKSGMGAILAAIKKATSPDEFSRVAENVPQAEELAAEGAEAPAGGGGLIGMLGKMVGAAGGPSAILAKLSAMGLTPEQIQKFLGAVVEFLKKNVSPEMLQKVMALVLSGAGGGK